MLLNELKNNFNMHNFIHYHDRRWGDGQVWKDSYFELISTEPPTYDYVNKTSTIRESKSEYTDDVLLGLGYNGNNDDDKIFEFMKTFGYDRIWNSGSNVYYINLK